MNELPPVPCQQFQPHFLKQGGQAAGGCYRRPELTSAKELPARTVPTVQGPARSQLLSKATFSVLSTASALRGSAVPKMESEIPTSGQHWQARTEKLLQP